MCSVYVSVFYVEIEKLPDPEKQQEPKKEEKNIYPIFLGNNFKSWLTSSEHKKNFDSARLFFQPKKTLRYFFCQYLI